MNHQEALEASKKLVSELSAQIAGLELARHSAFASQRRQWMSRRELDDIWRGLGNQYGTRDLRLQRDRFISIMAELSSLGIPETK